MEKCARGEVIPEITVAYYQKTKNGSLYLQSSRNSDGQCSGYQCHLRCGRDRPVETITFAFDSIRYSVTASTSVGKLETKTFTGKVPKN